MLFTKTINLAKVTFSTLALAVLMSLIMPLAAHAAPALPESRQPSQRTSQSISLDIENYSNTRICYLYISPSYSSSWGQDQLGDDVIRPGWYYTVYVRTGYYDLLAEDCYGNEMAKEFDVRISRDSSWTIWD